jgi:RHS repeat-associated protein
MTRGAVIHVRWRSELSSTSTMSFTVCAPHVCFVPSHFTGKERDSESGNDYFGARYYSSSMGRFMSPDWSAKVEPVPYAKLDDPQSLNLYQYVGNNPLGGWPRCRG